MSSRTYLSIGDVLTLLREEFPDVTISKIRFLESQGLVNPERSPSGYRKFFDHDVERLRWVLRQQREHFLPLKVIRDRLADGEADGGDPANGKPDQVTPAAVPQGAAAASDRPTRADEEAMARILADASRRAARRPEQPTSPSRGLQVVEERERSTAATVHASSARRRDAGEGTHTGGDASSTPVGSGGGRPSGAPAVPPTSSVAGAPETEGTGRDGAHLEGGNPGASGRGSGRERSRSKGTAQPARGTETGGTQGVVTGASLNLEELCAASGLSADEVAGLESFGLVESVNVAGIPTYDESALTVANLAAAFRVFGVEARHLRLYRNAADRELGLIEQVVIPLLRQRNPESRQKAVDAAAELAALGQSMRATLLQVALRQHLGG